MNRNVKRVMIIVTIALLGAGVVIGGVFSWQNFRGAGPAIAPPPDDITTLLNTSSEPANQNASGTEPAPSTNTSVSTQVTQNTTGFPLTLPTGYSIRVLAKELPNARDLVLDSAGNVWVSQLQAGRVTQLMVKDGVLVDRHSPFQNLRNPHGLAFDPTAPSVLYIAEERSISKARIGTEAPLEKLVDLPDGNNHNRRSLAFGTDGRLYVSIGSTCNVCVEENERNATVYSLLPDGSDFRQEATGLRNAAFLAVRPADGSLWVTENGRDLLGDNLPPEELNIIEQGKFYGWPYCYGRNIQDTKFDASAAAAARCAAAAPAHVTFQAHSAPLGLAFIPSTSAWPADWHGDLLVAYHGSWNRTQPTGYKVVRFDVAADGSITGEHDFITGWLTGDGALGRPVDVLPTDDGKLYISDDKAGLVYVVTRG